MSVSASGVSAAPPGSAVNVPALLELLDGHTGVAEKIRLHQEAKAAAEKALNDLRIGNDVRAALDEAQKKDQAAAETLAAALKDAERIVGDAKTQASAIIASAQDEQTMLRTALDAAKTVQDEWMKKTKAETDAKRKAAAAALAEAEKAKALHEAAVAGAAKTQDAANKKLQEAEDLIKNTQDRSDRLRAALLASV